MREISKIAFILIIVMVLFACATPQDYDNELNSLMGTSQAGLIKKFGKPSAVKIVDNNTKILAYTKVDDVFVPSEFYTYEQGEEIYGQDGLFSPFLNTYLFSNNPGDIGYEAEYICKTIFLLQDDKVTAWKWQGNNCVAN